MKADGKEVRFDSTREIDIFLEAKARKSRRTRQEVARDTLQEIALAYLDEINLAQDLQRSHGFVPEVGGKRRNRAD